MQRSTHPGLSADQHATTSLVVEKLQKENAATTIQTLARGFLARKKYKIDQLAPFKQKDYPAFVVGNDPFMPAELDNYHQPSEKIALIATSGMRAVSLACKLGNPKNTPKIILIDNSMQVHKFWQAMKEFVNNDKLAATEAMFLEKLPSFLKRNTEYYRDIDKFEYVPENVKYLNQDIPTYFKALIKKYSYAYVRSVITHTSFIKQSWEHTDTFLKLKNFLTLLGITKVYMYPSNIVSCTLNNAKQDRILKNIEDMAPVLSIHTDLCEFHEIPEKVYLFENQIPSFVKLSLFGMTSCKPDIHSINHEDLQAIIQQLFQNVDNGTNESEFTVQIVMNYK